MTAEKRCPVCKGTPERIADEGDVRSIHCYRCGDFRISRTLVNTLDTAIARTKRYILSAALRQASDSGRSITLKHDNLQEVKSAVVVPGTPLDEMDSILKYVAGKLPGAHRYIHLPERDYPIACAKSPGEFKYILRQMRDLGWLEKKQGSGTNEHRIGLEGWRRLAELPERPETDAAFVAMWFDADVEPAWREGIRPALEKTGYRPIRIDLEEHNEKICDRIIADIRKSSLLVADFTGHRGGVYFEAGFAMGLGIPVIWTCRSDQIEDAHFDTRQYNHIVWEAPEDLRAQLVNRIEATVGLQ